mgnify:CR=1 FL=1
MRKLKNEILVYQGDASLRMTVKTDGETVWFTQEQMCQLFGRERSVITKHIRNAFKEGGQQEDSVCAKFAHTAADGKVYQVAYYNLDVVISVGYRVKSLQGVRFRQWATRVLREMLLNRLDEAKRIAKLERRVDAVEDDVKQIKGGVNYLVKQLSVPVVPPRRRIGFGVDEHDMPQKQLEEALDGVVEECVNSVGADLNTASASLLSHIAGLSAAVSKNIVAYREENGSFTSRSELKKVPKLGPKAFEQCAGFLRVRDSDNPLDCSSVHPESYGIVDEMARSLGVSTSELVGNAELCSKLQPKDFITPEAGLPTINDIIKEIGNQIGPLKNQSEKAALYMEYKEELKKYELNLFMMDIEKFKKEYDEVEARYNSLVMEVEEKNENLEFKQEEKKELNGILAQIRSTIELKLNELNKAEMKLEQMKHDKILIGEKIINSQNSISAKNEMVATHDNMINAKKAALESNDLKFKATLEELEQKQAYYNDENATLDDFNALVDEYAHVENYAGAGKYLGYDIYEIKDEIKI